MIISLLSLCGVCMTWVVRRNQTDNAVRMRRTHRISCSPLEGTLFFLYNIRDNFKGSLCWMVFVLFVVLNWAWLLLHLFFDLKKTSTASLCLPEPSFFFPVLFFLFLMDVTVGLKSHQWYKSHQESSYHLQGMKVELDCPQKAACSKDHEWMSKSTGEGWEAGVLNFILVYFGKKTPMDKLQALLLLLLLFPSTPSTVFIFDVTDEKHCKNEHRLVARRLYNHSTSIASQLHDSLSTHSFLWKMEPPGVIKTSPETPKEK